MHRASGGRLHAGGNGSLMIFGMPSDAWLLLIVAIGLGLGLEIAFYRARRRGRGSDTK